VDLAEVVATVDVRLGIDFGTTSTVAVLDQEGGIATPLLFDASPLLGSGVFAGPGPELLTGADAVQAAAAHPGGFEPHPKRRVDEGTVWLGEHEVAVTDLIAAVLERAAREACRVVGASPESVVLTHPAMWGRARFDILRRAAGQAGLGALSLVPEPVAAAAYFATVLDRDVGVGRVLAVYDLGAGTFDISLVRRNGSGFETLAAAGLDDLGGIDLDQLVVEHARRLTTATADAEWGRLDWPQSAEDQRARRTLWESARGAKERLSRHAAADLYVPLANKTVQITRDEFELAARPLLQRSVELTLATLRQAGVTREALAGLFLVGGSSRVPLVATLLHRTLGRAPTVIDQPELAVATGSLHVDRPHPATPRADHEQVAPQPPGIAPAYPRPAGSAEPQERPLPHNSTQRTRRIYSARVTAAIALIALVPVDMALGGLILVNRGPASMVMLLMVQTAATLGWAWFRTRWIPRPGRGYITATVITTVPAILAALQSFRDLSSPIAPAIVITAAIMIAIGALLPAKLSN
jgi:Ethanolamine utilization protein EutJ (predicted chaperonin)